MAVTKKMNITNAATGQVVDSRDIGAEAQYIEVSRDANGEIISDITAEGVVVESTESLTDTLKNMQNSLVFDEVPTAGSDNPVRSKGLVPDSTLSPTSTKSIENRAVTQALNAKLSTYADNPNAWDTEPIENSTKPITSGGVKSALNNHYVTAGQLSGSTLGDNATAEGYSVIASGNQSHAEGSGTLANVSCAHAEGARSTASGANSHAEGTASLASAGAAHAEGSETTASGQRAHAEGQNTLANGRYSHAEGYQTSASGENSHAEGYQTSASGENSHAEGYQTSASGKYSHSKGYATAASSTASHAEGYQTSASGKYSHSEGYATAASSTASHAEGLNTIANERYSHAEGNETSASGYSSHAEGTNTLTIGQSSHAEGRSTVAKGTYSHAEGQSTTAFGYISHTEGQETITDSYYSHAEGYKTCAIGDASHAEGGYSNTVNRWGAYAIGDNSHAEGCNTSAIGEESHAEGFETCASGRYSHVEGCYSTASGSDGSHAEGNDTLASGPRSHAEGSWTTAAGNFSHAGGHGTIANYSQTVVGQQNVEKGSADSYTAGSGLFIVGSGINSSHANCFRATESNIYGKTYNTTGADYAEMFEWLDNNSNNEDRVGKFVTLDGDKIKLATSQDDYILGIVSGNASVIGDVYDDQWSGMFETDIYGRPIYEKQERELEDGTKVYDDILKVNPNYDSIKEYIPRSERPEWDAVGLLGKLICLDDGTGEVNGYVTVNDNSIATKAIGKTKYRVMKRIDESHIQIMIL